LLALESRVLLGHAPATMAALPGIGEITHLCAKDQSNAQEGPEPLPSTQRVSMDLGLMPGVRAHRNGFWPVGSGARRPLEGCVGAYPTGAMQFSENLSTRQ
jgi:hypothetical protein